MPAFGSETVAVPVRPESNPLTPEGCPLEPEGNPLAPEGCPMVLPAPGGNRLLTPIGTRALAGVCTTTVPTKFVPAGRIVMVWAAVICAATVHVTGPTGMLI